MHDRLVHCQGQAHEHMKLHYKKLLDCWFITAVLSTQTGTISPSSQAEVFDIITYLLCLTGDVRI